MEILKILFFVVFIAAWIGVRARVKAKVNTLTNPVNKAESILQSACKDMEELLAKLRSNLSAKDDQVRSGSSPLQPHTIEERKRALNELTSTFERAKTTSSPLERANKLQEFMTPYAKLSIDITSDTVEELETSLKTAEAVQIQKQTKTTEGSINDLRGHITAARNALDTARKATEPKVACNLVASAEHSVEAGLAVVKALRLVGNI